MSSTFFLVLAFLLTVLSRRRVENMPSPPADMYWTLFSLVKPHIFLKDK